MKPEGVIRNFLEVIIAETASLLSCLVQGDKVCSNPCASDDEDAE